MHVVVHAGFPKTGSSALQHFLADHREPLRSHGVLYPAFDDHFSHWRLAAAFTDVPEEHYLAQRLRDANARAEGARVRSELGEVLAGARSGDVVVLSNEAIVNDHSRPAGISEFRDRLLGRDRQVRVLAYVRNPLDLYASYVQQWLKSVSGRLCSPSAWRSGQGRNARLLIEVFGAERCEFRIYSSSTLIDGDIVADFGAYLQRTTGRGLPRPVRPYASNASLSGASCAILTTLRSGAGAALAPPEYKRIRTLLSQFDAVRPSPKLRLPSAWTRALIAGNGEEWNALVDLARCDEVRKGALRLHPDAVQPPTVTEAEVAEWCLSHASATFTTEFAAFCATRDGLRPAMAERIAARMRRFAETCPGT
jgi:hypothetical protein